MSHAKFTIPLPPNEPVKNYAPGAPETISLKARVDELRSQIIDIPIIIGGKEVRTGNTADCVCPP